MNKREYQSYLQSEYWRGFAKYIKAKRYNRCQLCGSSEELNVHHSPEGYKWLWKEYLHEDAVTVLCQPCHARHHEIPKEDSEEEFTDILQEYDESLCEIYCHGCPFENEEDGETSLVYEAENKPYAKLAVKYWTALDAMYWSKNRNRLRIVCRDKGDPSTCDEEIEDMMEEASTEYDAGLDLHFLGRKASVGGKA